MRRWGFVVVGLVGMAPVMVRADKPRKPTEPRAASEYPMRDAHDGVVIAAEPGDTKETRPDTRLDYAGREMMPIRVIVTNNSEKTVTLEDARIDFIASDNSKVTAATADELNRRMFDYKYAKGSTIPLPAPLPTIHTHNKPMDGKILADDEDFGFKTTTVKPHETVAGYLYYDTEGLPEPALEHATLELRKVRWQLPNSKVAGDQLDSFEIDLHPAKEASKK
jgi:hypothetical protein